MRNLTAILVAVFLLVPSIASALPRYECAEHQQVHLQPCHHHPSDAETSAPKEGSSDAHEPCAGHSPAEEPVKAQAHNTVDDHCCKLTADELPSDPSLKAKAVSLRSDSDMQAMLPVGSLPPLFAQAAAHCTYESTGPPRGDPVPLFVQHCAFLL